MKKRLIATMLTAVMVAGMMVGCGSKSEPATQAAATEAAKAETEAAKAETEAATEAAKPETAEKHLAVSYTHLLKVRGRGGAGQARKKCGAV